MKVIFGATVSTDLWKEGLAQSQSTLTVWLPFVEWDLEKEGYAAPAQDTPSKFMVDNLSVVNNSSNVCETKSEQSEAMEMVNINNESNNNAMNTLTGIDHSDINNSNNNNNKTTGDDIPYDVKSNGSPMNNEVHKRMHQCNGNNIKGAVTPCSTAVPVHRNPFRHSLPDLNIMLTSEAEDYLSYYPSLNLPLSIDPSKHPSIKSLCCQPWIATNSDICPWQTAVNYYYLHKSISESVSGLVSKRLIGKSSFPFEYAEKLNREYKQTIASIDTMVNKFYIFAKNGQNANNDISKLNGDNAVTSVANGSLERPINPGIPPFPSFSSPPPEMSCHVYTTPSTHVGTRPSSTGGKDIKRVSPLNHHTVESERSNGLKKSHVSKLMKDDTNAEVVHELGGTTILTGQDILQIEAFRVEKVRVPYIPLLSDILIIK